MIRSLDSLAIWLGDFYLLSTVLLVIALAAGVALRQPAKRLAINKATLVALAILAALCALPRWSVVHLRTAEQAGTASNVESQATAIAAASNLSESTKWPTNIEIAPLPLAKPASDAVTVSTVWNKISGQQVLAMLYVAGAVGVFVWLIIGQLAAVRLRRQAQPAPAELTAMLEEVATRSRVSPKLETCGRVSPRLGFNEHDKTTEEVGRVDGATPLIASFGETGLHFPELLISERIAAPVALGIRQPTIILPKSWLSQLPLPDREGLGEGSAARSAKAPSPFPLPKGDGLDSTAHLRSILAHELAHIRNHDLAWLAVSRVLLVVLWAQPLFWLVRRQMRFDQETLADAAAAELTSRQHYAEQLVAWARTLSTQSLPMRLSPAVGLWEGASQIRKRIALLLNEKLKIHHDCSSMWHFAVVALSLTAVFALSQLTLQPAAQAAPNAQSALATDVKPSEVDATSKAKDSKNDNIPKLLYFRVRVVDESGRPVAKAVVEPLGVSSQGLAINWAQVTNEQGFASVPYPQVAIDELGVRSITVVVKHAEYVSAVDYILVGESERVIKLLRGGAVEISAATKANDNHYGLVYGLVDKLDPTLPWSRINDKTIRSPQLAPGAQVVRAVSFSAKGSVLFSELRHVQVNAGKVTQLQYELRPGWQLEGRLSDEVPRPIQNGRVMLWMSSAVGGGWHDWTTVRDDGTFTFDSLPPDSGADVGVAAICKGYVSKPSQDASEELWKQFVVPQRILFNQDKTKCVVKMSPTAQCVVKVVDPQGKPISGVRVFAQLNTYWSGGSFSFPVLGTMKESMTSGNDNRTVIVSDPVVFPYDVTTGENGIAELTNLPPVVTILTASHDHYELPHYPGLLGPFSYADLQAGKTANVTLTMLKRKVLSANKNTKDRTPIRQLAE